MTTRELSKALITEANINRLCGSLEWSDLLGSAAEALDRLELNLACTQARLDECQKLRAALVKALYKSNDAKS